MKKFKTTLETRKKTAMKWLLQNNMDDELPHIEGVAKMRVNGRTMLSAKDPNKDYIIVIGKCHITGLVIATEPIPTIGLLNWKAGLLIQEALPMVSPEDREFLLTSISGHAFDELFEEDAAHAYNELIEKELPNNSYIDNTILLKNVTFKRRGFSAVDEGHFILSEDSKSFRMSDNTIKKVENFSKRQNE